MADNEPRTQSKLDAIRSRLYFDSHHEMERFSVLALVVLLIMSLTLVMSWRGFAEKQSFDLTSKAVYTDTWSFSKSGANGEVVDVYRSEDGKRAFVMMKTGSSHMNSLSMDAANYQAFVTGRAKPGDKRLALHPTLRGGVYVYGNTGYFGIMLIDSQGLESRLYDIYLRHTDELVEMKDVTSTDVADGSFLKFDQTQIVVNPLGEQAQVVEALNEDRIDPGLLFSDTVLSIREKEIKDSIDSQLAVMKRDLNIVEDNRKRVEGFSLGGLKVVVPDYPQWMKGDSIECDEEATTKAADKNGRKVAVARQSEEEATASASASASAEPSCKLKLTTETHMPRAYVFDWTVPMSEGWISQLTDEQNHVLWYADEQAKRKSAKGFSIEASPVTLSDGRKLVDLDTSAFSLVGDVNTAVTTLEDSYKTYMSDKAKLEEDIIPSLLDLEILSENSMSNYSVNLEKDAMISYS